MTGGSQERPRRGARERVASIHRITEKEGVLGSSYAAPINDLKSLCKKSHEIHRLLSYLRYNLTLRKDQGREQSKWEYSLVNEYAEQRVTPR